MSLTIVQVATSFSGWGPDELHILDLSERLARRGHRVTVACRAGGWVEQQAKRMGLPSAPFRVTRQQDARDLGRLVRFFRANRVDAVHVHAHCDYVVPALAARLAGVPVRVMTGHHLRTLSSPRGARLYSDRLYTHVIAVSRAVRERLVESGMTAHKISVIPYGVEVDPSLEAVRPPAPAGALVVGIVGRIAHDRGHFDLIEAASRLRGRFPLHYAIIGGGPDEDAVRAQIATKGLSDLFSFTGFRADMDGLVAGLDILVAPAASANTCCAIIQKAMLLGKPVIGSRAGGNEDLIGDGRTGLLVPPWGASHLAEALARLAVDAQLRAEIGQAAGARAAACFSLEGYVGRFDALYQSGRQGRRPGGSAAEALRGPS